MSALEFFVIVALLIGSVALLLGLIQVASPALAQGKWPSQWHFSLRSWHMLLAAAILFCAAIIVRDQAGLLLLFLAAFVLMAYYLVRWRQEFLFLMSLRDDQFPGRHDKILWTVVLIVLPPIGLWAFRSYHLAHWPEPSTERLPGKPAPDPYY